MVSALTPCLLLAGASHLIDLFEQSGVGDVVPIGVNDDLIFLPIGVWVDVPHFQAMRVVDERLVGFEAPAIAGREVLPDSCLGNVAEDRCLAVPHDEPRPGAGPDLAQHLINRRRLVVDGVVIPHRPIALRRRSVAGVRPGEDAR